MYIREIFSNIQWIEEDRHFLINGQIITNILNEFKNDVTKINIAIYSDFMLLSMWLQEKHRKLIHTITDYILFL